MKADGNRMELSWPERMRKLGGVVIIPTYNNDKTLGDVVAEVLEYASDVIVVNDGSTDRTEEVLRNFPSVRVIRHERNKGKGSALKNGLSQAKKSGYRVAITIDSDGQHYPSDLPLFIEAAEQNPDALYVGARNIESENMPGKNTFANKFSNFWYRLETGIALPDTQSGYRLYPLKKMNVDRFWYTAKYEFELEALVFAAWGGVEVRSIPIRVYYPPQEERVSHFRPMRDFTRISVLNTLLVLLRVFWIFPRNLVRALAWQLGFYSVLLTAVSMLAVIAFSVSFDFSSCRFHAVGNPFWESDGGIVALVFLLLQWAVFGRFELAFLSSLPIQVGMLSVGALESYGGTVYGRTVEMLTIAAMGLGGLAGGLSVARQLWCFRRGIQGYRLHGVVMYYSALVMVAGMAMVLFPKSSLFEISSLAFLTYAAQLATAYSVVPLLFDIFISRPASRGLRPYTLAGFLQTFLTYNVFLLGCIVLHVVLPFLLILPLRQSRKQALTCGLMHYTCRFLLWSAFFVRKKKLFDEGCLPIKPAVVIANHQSFVDILIMIALFPKLLIVTNRWVWNSPVFGAVIRYAGFVCVADGYEKNMDYLKRKMAEGYSVGIFPEGTRSTDGRIRRFHKGAFYLAEELNADLLPMLFYGNGHIIPKQQPGYVHRGLMAVRVLPLIPADDKTYGATYQERTKRIGALMRREYDRLCSSMQSADNPNVVSAFLHHYIYKGPIVEWYLKVKFRLEHHYRLFDRLLPAGGVLTDIGCGMGMLCRLLAMTSAERQVTGIDYDRRKIDIAAHGWHRPDNLHFVCADVSRCELPLSDAFIISDVLHYLGDKEQEDLLARCAARLNPGGMIVVRDSNAAERKKHRLTVLTEILSTRVCLFNKTKGKLNYTSRPHLQSVASSLGMRLEDVPGGDSRITANAVYVLKKKE